jgi:hypothetical protein
MAMSAATPTATLAEQIAEIRREMKQRERVYPRLILAGKMTQDAANRQTRFMQAALETLEACQAGQPPAPDAPPPQGSLI